jgi:hypothetical protein
MHRAYILPIFAVLALAAAPRAEADQPAGAGNDDPNGKRGQELPEARDHDGATRSKTRPQTPSSSSSGSTRVAARG